MSSDELPLPLGIWKLFPEAQRHLEPWQRPAMVSKGLELCREHKRNRSESQPSAGRRLGREPTLTWRPEQGGQWEQTQECARPFTRVSPAAPPSLQGGHAPCSAALDPEEARAAGRGEGGKGNGAERVPHTRRKCALKSDFSDLSQDDLETSSQSCRALKPAVHVTRAPQNLGG